MPLIEQTLSGQEIIVPPKLPSILKQFCKAAIRTQPYDLIKWSSAYFRALADGEEPPTKLRLECPPSNVGSNLTLGFLRVLLRQFGDYNKTLSMETISHRWDCLCLDRKDLNLIVMIGRFRHKCEIKKFLAIAVGLLGSSLHETMIMICELFTHEPDGGSAMIPATLFMEIYGYLAGLRCDGSKRDSFEESIMDSPVFWEEERNSSKTLLKMSKLEENSQQDSNASQDTDGDTNIMEFVTSADEADSSKFISGGSRAFSTTNEVMSELMEEVSSSSDTLKYGENIEPRSKFKTKTNVESNNEPLENESNDQELSPKTSDDNVYSNDDDGSISNIQKKTEDSKNIKNNGGRMKKLTKSQDSNPLKYHPNVPGIGSRLSAEEVAAVAMWISGCARLQEGMVGPRNLRHIQCPPLDK